MKKKSSKVAVVETDEAKHNHQECICGKSADGVCRCECQACQETEMIPAGCNCEGCNCK